MAEPTDQPTDQSIQSSPAAGHVTLPDGRVVPTLDTWFNQQANNPQGFGASEQRTALSQAYTNRVAQPLTNALGDFITSVPQDVAAERLGLVTPEPVRNAGRAIAGAVIPQNLTQLGIDAGMLAGGGVGGALKLGRALTAGTSVMGAVAGGAAGGAAETGDVKGALTGAGQGLVQGGMGTSATELYNYSRKLGVQRALKARDLMDAENTGAAIQANPKLKGVFGQVPTTPEGLRDLALGTIPDPKNPGKVIGKGEAMLGQYLDQADAQITARIQQQESQYGRKYLFPDPYTPGQNLPYDEAREQLTKLGRIAGKIKPQQEITIGGQRLSGGDVKELYATTLRAWQQQLALIDSQAPNLPSALTAFNESRAANEAAVATLDFLGKLFKGPKLADRVALNSDKAHDLLANNQKQLTNKLGVEGFNGLADAFRVEGKLGLRDVASPTGMMSQMAGVVPGAAGAYMRFHVGAPQLVGNPLSLSRAATQGVNLTGTQLTAPVAQLLADQLRNQGGLPLK